MISPEQRETAQQYADRLLSFWQLQRAAGIKPQFRRLPANDSLERDLELIRTCMR
jgi:hypothetical protein